MHNKVWAKHAIAEEVYESIMCQMPLCYESPVQYDTSGNDPRHAKKSAAGTFIFINKSDTWKNLEKIFLAVHKIPNLSFSLLVSEIINSRNSDINRAFMVHNDLPKKPNIFVNFATETIS